MGTYRKSGSRWKAVLRKYNSVRHCLLRNKELLQGTDLVLLPLNEKRLVTWYKDDNHRVELQTVLGGTWLMPRIETAAHALLPAKTRPSVTLKSSASCGVLLEDTECTSMDVGNCTTTIADDVSDSIAEVVAEDSNDSSMEVAARDEFVMELDVEANLHNYTNSKVQFKYKRVYLS